MIYLDNNATTRMDDRVVAAMLPYMTDHYGNPASNHSFGVEINRGVKAARKQVAEIIGAEPTEIIFTSGATEAINLAIKGVAKSYHSKGRHIITVATEHSATLDTCKYLEDDGYDVTYLNVNGDGIIDANELKGSLRADTILVSVMYVNNETGTVQPVEEIARIAHKAGVFFMTDATQAVGKVKFDVNDLGIDLLVLSAHKFYGPKGVGALYYRNRRPNKVSVHTLIHGGGHEKGIRSGTLNVPGIVGLGKACELAMEEMRQNEKLIRTLRDYLETALLSVNMTKLNGSTEQRLYNVSNIMFKNVDAEAMITGLSDIMVSTGSACTSTKTQPSHVLKAIGLSDEDAYSSIRFSLGKYNSKEQIDTVIQRLKFEIEKLRSMAPSFFS